MDSVSARYAFASDNTAGACPEALAALVAANAGRVPSYGEDAATRAAKVALAELFETECDVFFVFNGTAANALALAAVCRSHHGILCHELSHLETDECAAPEFFSGGAKVLPVRTTGTKLTPADLAPWPGRGHGVHFSKLRAVSITQSTELGTVYTPDEIRGVSEFARAHGWLVHMDGARFANAAATLAGRGYSPADFTWRAGVDVLCFGGTKNGLIGTEAVVFFNRTLAAEFDYKVKQAGQLASKQRYAGAQWLAVLRDGTWLRHAAHANAMARRLSDGLVARGFQLVAPTEANGVFVHLTPEEHGRLEAQGWHFYPFVGETGHRLMCGWDARPEEIDAFLAAAGRLRT
jgi:threonine aldolase